MRIIWDHSLSIASLLLGVAASAIAFRLIEDGRWFDLWLGVGQSFITVGGFGFLSGLLKEVNKPEEEPL